MRALAALFFILICILIPYGLFASKQTLLTDPFLQMLTSDSISVVWFTEFPSSENHVEYGEDLSLRAPACTILLSKMKEDAADGQGTVARSIYRHHAVLCDLSAKTAYRVVSTSLNGERIVSDTFFCSAPPQKGASLKILFTSDHQGKPMVAANMQKVKEIEPNIDAVFYAGDFVDHPDKASEWFDGNGFFPCSQGYAEKILHDSLYTGGQILQYAPLFGTIGNHEVMGREDLKMSLDQQFEDAHPLEENGFNCDSYKEIFGGKPYYATSFGDVRLVVLYATRIWRDPELGVKGKYSEDPATFSDPQQWGHGDFIFEPIQRGSAQYKWLEEELQSPEFTEAKYRIVMLHNPLHSLGENAIPPFTDPVQQIEVDAEGKIQVIRYHYPIEEDYLIRDIEPLLEQSGVDLVLCGHSHVWNRFQSPAGVHHLETSNVGNSYGASFKTARLLGPNGMVDENYVAFGDPNGLEPIVPTIVPFINAEGEPLPFLSSNTITAFSILNTDTGAVDSYYFNTEDPNSPVVHFDRFHLRYAGALPTGRRSN